MFSNDIAIHHSTAVGSFPFNCVHAINLNIKVGLSPSKKICVICLIESPLKMKKNAFYFILKTLYVLKIFKFLLRLFGHVGKRLD